ncbi:MAG: calcineurin-like phosphoesterase family protein [Bacillales bacterium]|nr:calcineurin-like phosphoesterase family protein [Bacillales bacterium]
MILNILNNKILWFLLLILFLVVFLHIQNNWIETTKVTVDSQKTPKNFKGYKIVQLSDLHNKMFKNNQESLVDKIDKINPDIVVITGDIIDSRRYDLYPSLTLVKKLAPKYPIYYVTGNHEQRIEEFDDLIEMLKANGVVVLSNESVEIEIKGHKILLSGVEDPSYPADSYDENEQIARNLEKVQNGDLLNILLSHRPEHFEQYVEFNFDLVFSGHAHGGQFDLPFIGGVIAPNQGLFPKYTKGVHTKNNTNMVVSRGLGNSIFPFRLFNRPEIIVATLK